ncbi:54S ribosomal protein L12 [Metarhizium album ARSEF 1941]|uniref:54S ribosomal protein L12 n=1 Tax=Metarhizium album (strain ARSEF 1941) TaxID=1081103 RepID=A0A0B2X2N9_METAS|nr:54S ribosomal protein L12 [Metarhizium album ARSEF 1941]KHN99535.1 54S ribosomal protein L12 [Metarhizium album ARSEF 1941]
MAMSCRHAAQSCARQFRPFGSAKFPVHMLRIAPTTRRLNSTEAAPTNPKIAEIVDQISQLTLLETADLVSSLKTRLNIPDMPMGGFAAAAPPAAPAAEEPEEAAPAAAEKSLFTLKLQAFDAGAKAKIIKEVKSLLGLSLVDSKKFVESAPKMMKENIPKEEAEKIIASMKELGATVIME